ncbi:hypothetical protein DITRI_Ditri17bG0023100 [Diplodiscus trichospermus]
MRKLMYIVSYIYSYDSSYCRGDKEENQRGAGVADEDAERRKHFDEEAGFDNLNRGTMAGSSKSGIQASMIVSVAPWEGKFLRTRTLEKMCKARNYDVLLRALKEIVICKWVFAVFVSF